MSIPVSTSVTGVGATYTVSVGATAGVPLLQPLAPRLGWPFVELLRQLPSSLVRELVLDIVLVITRHKLVAKPRAILIFGGLMNQFQMATHSQMAIHTQTQILADLLRQMSLMTTTHHGIVKNCGA